MSNRLDLARAWDQLNQNIENCRGCPRLIAHCEEMAATKRASYRDEVYWGRPVPNFGDPAGRLLIVGLAPGAHGANRTGRMFTGDRSGEWLYRALHRAGLAHSSAYHHRDDGQRLIDCAITAVCHCAPPDNRPTPSEISECRPFLQRTWEILQPRVVVALGQLAWRQALELIGANGDLPRPRPRFQHGASWRNSRGVYLLGSYHPSQQNTFTGKLTEPMFDDIFGTARRWLETPEEELP